MAPVSSGGGTTGGLVSVDSVEFDGTFLALGTSFASDARPLTVRPLPVIGRLDTASLALGWLFDRDVSGFVLAVLSPFLALMTIWDAVMSAGSGLVAPAAGLAAVVAVAIADRDLWVERLRRGGRTEASI